MTKPLQSKVALITGASRGIGRAIAIQLASLGADIVINYVRDQEAASQVETLVKNAGCRAISVQANVGDPVQIETLVKTALSEFGRVDILVHNAALGAFKPVHKLRINQWDISIDINTKAFYLLAQKLVPFMEKQGGGNMIAISSLGAHRFIPNYGAIGVSKAALETLVKYLAAELAPKGIRVNGVSGGLVDTDALKSFPGYDEMKKEVVSRTPAGRIGQPDDLARVVAFLTTDESRWIIGQMIIADGGLSLI
jgi:enoyl-[acyl-carrier protein] reductase III